VEQELFGEARFGAAKYKMFEVPKRSGGMLP
jgi:hypothetical protein